MTLALAALRASRRPGGVRARCLAQTRRAYSDASRGPTDQSVLLPGQFLVGPPHPVSNIRPVRFYVAADETAVEKRYREMREAVAEQDHQFWLDNNSRFEQGKAEFERQTTATKGVCSIDDLSTYYKQYQIDSYQRHLEYNRTVWARGFRMVWPGIRAWAVDIRRRRARRVSAVARHSEQGYFDRGPVAEHRSDRPPPDAGSKPSTVDRRAEKIRSYY
ncbi:hypothetical protein H4R19_003044 [Coemansia spiralis]|nr:hypothetical protein H4R19_003044 [Coemansia spiralis]